MTKKNEKKAKNSLGYTKLHIRAEYKKLFERTEFIFSSVSSAEWILFIDLVTRKYHRSIESFESHLNPHTHNYPPTHTHIHTYKKTRLKYVVFTESRTQWNLFGNTYHRNAGYSPMPIKYIISRRVVMSPPWPPASYRPFNPFPRQALGTTGGPCTTLDHGVLRKIIRKIVSRRLKIK